MYEFYPYFTNDGSVGLYSNDVDDIYHSTYGALTEAYEKFVLPSNLNEILKNKKEIKLLDICFGIGYNTKVLINEIIKNNYNETIHADNIKYIDKTDSNNRFCKISVHAIDIDKNLSCLSPFFITGKKLYKNYKLPFVQEKISKMLAKNTNSKYKLKNETKFIFYELIKDQLDSSIFEIIDNKKYRNYFDKKLTNLMRLDLYERGINTNLNPLCRFLHNIYYKYISTSNKKALKYLKRQDFKIKLNIADARKIIKNDSEIYNLIFLDAFTPVKCPCLWTVDFFRELYKHLDSDGMLLTYSNSAQVRNALLNAGFYVGKIFSSTYNKYSGTVAVKNKTLIKNELSEYDLGLLNTRAGIFYRDESLTLDNEAIMSAYNFEVMNSNQISSSKFIKQYNKEHQDENI